MNDYLCILRPARAGLVDAPTEDETSAVGAHFAYLQQLTASGVVRLVGRTAANGLDTMGIVLYRAETLERAEALASADPAVAQGVMTATIQAFHVALVADSVIE
jgi:uncharacterized protein YciI